MAEVVIYSFLDVFYYSFYIEAFYSIYGRENVHFAYSQFPKFADRSLAAIVASNDQEVRLIIDANDTPKITPELLEWCDVYGKVNFNRDYIQQDKQKIIPIGPNLGVRTWNILETMNLSVSNYWRSREKIESPKNFFANYWRQYNRLPLNAFQKAAPVNKNYIFFISSLWKNDMATNISRSNFILACSELKEIEFEGGFAPRTDRKKIGFEELIDKRIDFKDYVEKIRRSIVVYNTPAVENCHGWKLAEFLALGKAIISTKPINDLPAPLIHGKHIHYTSGDKEDIKEAIYTLINNKGYRGVLEINARKYFEKHLVPDVVLQKLLRVS